MKALVIGGSNGIGLAIVKRLIARGYFVEIIDRVAPEEGSFAADNYCYQSCDLLELDEDLIRKYVDDPAHWCLTL